MKRTMTIPPIRLETENPRPLPTLGFAGRSEILALWDRLTADQQTGLLIAARGMVKRNQGGSASNERIEPAPRGNLRAI